MREEGEGKERDEWGRKRKKEGRGRDRRGWQR